VAGGHLLFIGGGVIVVRIGKDCADALRQQLANGRFAGAGDPHQYNNHSFEILSRLADPLAS